MYTAVCRLSTTTVHLKRIEHVFWHPLFPESNAYKTREYAFEKNCVDREEKSEDFWHFQDAAIHLRYKVKQLAVTLWPLCPASVVWPKSVSKPRQESCASMIQCLTFKSRESDPEGKIISKQFQASNRAVHFYASSDITIGFTATGRFGVVSC